MLRVLLAPAALLALVESVAACTSTVTPPNADDSADAGPLPEPLVHRAYASACTAARPAGTPNPTPTSGSPCEKDRDCTAGLNGRCENEPFGSTDPMSNYCSYDMCANDVDCGGNQVCECRSTSARDENVCFLSTCHIDGDCGSGGWCSPSATGFDPTCLYGISFGSIGYFCHTPHDECTDDKDCTGKTDSCIFNVDVVHWICIAKACAQ